jgi:phosphoribosylformylglycinamidine synthase
VFRYCGPDGAVADEHNPNGALRGIAGICNAAGTVVGIMPHPERAADPLLGAPGGLGFFTSLAAWRPRDATLKVPTR